MNYFTDLSFVGGLFVTLTVAIVILLQVIKGLATAISTKMKKSIN